jgi:enolase
MSDFKIKSMKARQILDSRGNPTVEIEIASRYHRAKASVPSGASTGIHEALELRDNLKPYSGKGVTKAVRHINNIIAKKLVGKNCSRQEQLDNLMIKLDGTKNKKRLGANAILAVSLAISRLAAKCFDIPLYEYIRLISGTKHMSLPVPCFNIINGGKHADDGLDFQEYMLIPKTKTFKDALKVGSEIYHELKRVLHKKVSHLSTNVGDEGGFAPELENMEAPIELILKAAKRLGYENNVQIGIDVAASEFYSKGKYKLEGKSISGDKLIKVYQALLEHFPIVSIEDPFEQDDYKNFHELKKQIGHKLQIVGDDLLVTNIERIKKAKQLDLCNALLLKVNQIGTLTEAIDAAKLARIYGWNVMVSHRSGETNDDFIADLAVGLGAGQIKAGAPCRGERLAKYNRLAEIEERSKLKMKSNPFRVS